MTIVEALSRISRRYSSRAYSALSAAETQEALEGLNAGMQELYSLLPEGYKIKPLSLSVEAPANETVNATEGSATLTADDFATADIGKTFVSSADPLWHRVAAINAFRDVWLGATGAEAGILYHDFIFGDDYPFVRLVSDPVLLDGAQAHPLRLLQQSQIDKQEIAGVTASVGRPRYYWIEQQGTSQGLDPMIAIRLLPVPDRAYRIRVRASYLPRRALFADIAANGVLPIPDSCVEAFIQIVGAHMSGLKGWDAVTPAKAESDALAGRSIPSRLPPHMHLQISRVGTPAYF